MNEKNQNIHIAVIGSRKSGKSALTEALIRRADQDGSLRLHFDEHHSHEEADCEEHELVLQVVDAMNLEQSLALAPSFIDHAHHLVIAINRYDLLRATGHVLDIEKLSELIGVPVLTVSAETGEGLNKLYDTICHVRRQAHSSAHPVVHGWEQSDRDAYKAFVHGALMQTLSHPQDDFHTRMERVDRVLTHRVLGPVILMALMSFVFWITFSLGDPLGELLDGSIQWLHDLTLRHMEVGALSSLLAEGVILGVGSLLTALPNIIILFFFLSLMEDSGYMARVAFMTDPLMHRIGLHGRSFIPMLMGFDCNVPAIMAAKDILDKRERWLTMLMVPFMSCSARLPVYILLINAFFPTHKALVLGSLYLTGILLSFAFAWVMKHTRWFRTEDTDSVNELPDFRVPGARSIGGHIWYRVSDFLQKISTVVLCASIIIWALEYYPAGDLMHLEQSWLAWIGRLIAPVMAPLGMDWKMAVCLLTGLPAKEAIAATFAILFGSGEAAIAASGMSAVSAYAFLIFTLLYFPCVATIATIRREINWRWATFVVVHSILLAWLCSFLVYQIGTVLVG